MQTLPKWLKYIESQIGFILPENQHNWLQNAIQSTADNEGLTLDALWDEVQKSPSIKQKLLNSILILESRFFRHIPSIEFITEFAQQWQIRHDEVCSHFQDKPIHKEKFRVWSVGCSEGQEAWSIAMSLEQANIEDFYILGTDISTKAIATAKKAVYGKKLQKDIPIDYRHFAQSLSDEDIHFQLQHLGQPHNGYWTLNKALKHKVGFVLNNIFLPYTAENRPSAQMLNKQDVIICQNMLIYFRQFDQRDILARLVSRCRVGGYIILAPGEALFWDHPQMRRVERERINAWQKIK